MPALRVRNPISHKESKSKFFMKFLVILMWYWCIDIMILPTVTGWLKLWCFCTEEYLVFSCYVTGFLVEIYKSYIMIMNSSSIWYVHVNMNSDSMWINKIRSLHMEAVMRSLYVKAVIWKLWDLSTLEVVGQNEIPLNLEVRGSPCRLLLCDDSHELSSLPDQTTQGQ